MTVGTDRSASDIIDGLFKRVEQVERHRVFLRDENGNIEFESPINVGGGTIIGGDAAVAPTNLVLTPGVTLNTIFVDISWDPSANVSYYDVLVVENVSGIVHTQVNVGGESTRVTGLEPNTLYDVNVRAVDNIGRSSAPLAGQFISVGDTTAPPQVAGLVVTAGLQSLVAVWNESTAEDVKDGHGIYEVQIDTANTFNTVNLRSIRTSGTITSWTDLDPNTTYYVRVKAIDSSGNEGAWSTIQSGITGSTRDFTTDPILTTEIADDAITAPKIAANQIAAGHLVTGTAVITGTAQIADAIINSAKIISLDAALVTFGTMSGDRIAANTLDVNRLKASTLSATTITLATDGRFLANGAAGSLYIDGNGVQLFDAVNGGGTRTVFLDAATGNATFSGTLSGATGSFSGTITATGGSITGNLIVSGTLTGGTYQTATSGRRMVLDSTTKPVKWYTGDVNENAPGYIWQDDIEVIAGKPNPTLFVEAPNVSNIGNTAVFYLRSGNVDNTLGSLASLEADRISLNAPLTEARDIIPIYNNVEDLGSASSQWRYIYADKLWLSGFESSGDTILPLTYVSSGDYSLYADNAGNGAQGRLWWHTPNGGEIVLGPRGGADFLNRLRVRGPALVEGTITQATATTVMIMNGANFHSLDASGTYIVTSYAREYIYDTQARVASLHPSSGYVDHYAAAHVIGSSRELKSGIKDANLQASNIIKRGRRVRRYKYANASVRPKRRVMPELRDAEGKFVKAGRPEQELDPDPVHARERLGWVAEEAPEEIVVKDADGNPEGIDLTAVSAVLWAGLADVVDRLEALETKV